jgi:hypothetical protein
MKQPNSTSKPSGLAGMNRGEFNKSEACEAFLLRVPDGKVRAFESDISVCWLLSLLFLV